VFVLITFYKTELTTLLIDNLRKDYGLDLKVGDIKVSFFSNWPHASVQLKNISIASDLSGPGQKPILKAGSVSLSFNLEKMLDKQFIVKYVSFKDAEINLIKQKDSTTNFKFKKPARDSVSSAPPISFALSKITLKNVQFNFINEQKGQKMAITLVDNVVRLKIYSDGISANLNGKVFFGGLLFNPRKGEFLHSAKTFVALDVDYFKDSRSICVRPSSYVEISHEIYKLASIIELGEERKLSLLIESDHADYFKVSDLLTPKMQKVLSGFDVKRSLFVKTLLKVNIGKKEDPILLVDVVGKNNDLIIGNSRIPYSDISFTGKIISLHPSHQRGDMENARLIFEPVKGKVYDFPFTATVTVKNLVSPNINIYSNLFIDATKIKFDIAKDFVLKGSAVAVIKYSGPTEKLNKRDFLEKPMELNADITFNNLSYKEIEKPYVYTVNGKANLNNHDLKFDNLRLKTNIADAVLKGKADNFVTYVLGYSKGIKANLAARTEHLDLNPLLTKKEDVEAQSARSGKPGNKRNNHSQFEFNVNLFAKKMIARSVEAQNVNVYLNYKNDLLDIRSVNLNTCDGKIAAKGTVEGLSKINADVSIQNVNVNKLFTQFENFGQTAIESSNLRGNMFVDAKLSMQLDEKMSVKGETMNAEVKVKLKDGHLVNYEPIQNLSNFLFRNRDFNDVTFSEINETFKIRGYEMQIRELEVGSNVLNLYVVNGLYNLKGNSNINILVPWSNLKKRGKNYVPKNTGESAENTKGLKLNFYGPNKQMKISFGHKEQEKRFW
jgi:hypothetical protein